MEEKLIYDHLSLLGFDDDEIAIYKALVSYGAMPVGKLAQTSGVERTTVHRMLDDLEDKGVVTIQEANKRKIIHPSSLSHLLKDEELRVEKLKSQQAEFNDLVGSLTGSRNATKVRFYYGIEGIKQAIWNNLDHQKQNIYSLRQQSFEHTFDYLFTEDYSARLKQNKIHNYVVTNQVCSSKYDNISYSYIDSPEFVIAKDFDVYDHTTVYYSWGQEPYAAEIFDKNLASTNQQLVQMLIKMRR